MKNTDTFVAFGDTLKTTKSGNQGIVEAFGVRFTGPNDRDLDGEYFTADTDYGPHKGNGMAATLNHRIPMITASTKADELPVLRDYARRIFSNAVAAEVTPRGIIARHILDLADDYEAMIFEMAQNHKLRWSSGAPGHMVDKDETKRITTWHIAEWAYTPIAADPNLPTITPIKSLADVELSTAQPVADAEISAPEAEWLANVTLSTAQPAEDIEPVVAAPTEDDDTQPVAEAESSAPEAQSQVAPEAQSQPATPEPEEQPATPEPEEDYSQLVEVLGDFIETISERIGRLRS